jgi:hypothetical protein
MESRNSGVNLLARFIVFDEMACLERGNYVGLLIDSNKGLRDSANAAHWVPSVPTKVLRMIQI